MSYFSTPFVENSYVSDDKAEDRPRHRQNGYVGLVTIYPQLLGNSSLHYFCNFTPNNYRYTLGFSSYCSSVGGNGLESLIMHDIISMRCTISRAITRGREG